MGAIAPSFAPRALRIDGKAKRERLWLAPPKMWDAAHTSTWQPGDFKTTRASALHVDKREAPGGFPFSVNTTCAGCSLGGRTLAQRLATSLHGLPLVSRVE